MKAQTRRLSRLARGPIPAGLLGVGDVIYTSTSTIQAPPATIRVLVRGTDTALERLRQEAGALGAVGILDIRLTVTTTGHGYGTVWSFLATVGRLGPNREIDAYTEVVAAARGQVRRDFAVAARSVGADACVVSSMNLTLDVGDQESYSARAIITGTALARFEVRHDEPAALSMLPFKGRRCT